MRTAILSSLLTLLVLVGALLLLSHYSGPKGDKKLLERKGDFLDLHVRLPLPWIFSGREPEPNRLVYLNREGALLRGGGDDSTTNRASLAGPSESDTIDLPGYQGSHSTWQQTLACVREAFAPFNVRIVDQRPVTGDYLMVLAGGSSRVLKGKGKSHANATGLAPHNGLPIHNAVALVFTQTTGAQIRQTCETIVHEIGHTYGLDHAHDCRDFMTYLPYCGKKRFVDKDVRCGEHKTRECKGGKPTQNSYQELARVLGLKKTT